MIDPAAVAANLARVRERIAHAGGDPGRITVVAVTKAFGPDAIAAAAAAGLTDIGENYAQELLAKLPAVTPAGRPPGVRVHFIGHLQSNKVRLLAPVVDLWQTIDRRSLVEEVARRAPPSHRQVMVQVNVSDEPQKGGCRPDEVPGLVQAATGAGLVVVGLMAIGRTGPPEGARPGFRLLRSLADDLGLPERSMGMTDDLEVAVEEGSTMVRVGTALFGPRRVA